MQVAIFIHTADHFDCAAMAKYLRGHLDSLSKLSYENIKHNLRAENVIVRQEYKKIGKMIDTDQMAEVIDILISSLCSNVTTKFKGFLKALEESGDELLMKTAAELGK